MRYIKITLAVLLALVGIAFCATAASRYLLGVEDGPVIRLEEDLIQISVNDSQDALMAGVTASDPQDGDLTGKIYIQGVSKLITDNTAKVSYIVFDRHGNLATATRMVRYTDYSKPHFYVDQPLIYGENESIKLLDRIHVEDVLDGDLTKSVRVSGRNATSDPENWTVAVQVTNSMGDTARLQVPVVVHTGVVARPEVHLSSYLVYMNQGDQFNGRSFVREVTTPEGVADKSAVKIVGDVNTSVPGTYYVYYRYPYGVTTGVSVLTVVVE